MSGPFFGGSCPIMYTFYKARRPEDIIVDSRMIRNDDLGNIMTPNIHYRRLQNDLKDLGALSGKNNLILAQRP